MIFWQYVLPALLGFVAGTIGSLVAPWVNWRIEKKRLALQYKRQTVAEWRAMLADAAVKTTAETDRPLAYYLERNAGFYSLREHLRPDTLAGLVGRTVFVGPDQSTVDGVVGRISEDISAVEKNWGLKDD